MFYAGENRYGVNLTMNSIGWTVYGFDTKKQRDEWIEEDEYSGCNRIRCTMPASIAYKQMRKQWHDVGVYGPDAEKPWTLADEKHFFDYRVANDFFTSIREG